MENYNLAYEWIRFGLKKFPFKELEQLRIEVKNNIDEQRNNKVD